MSFGNWFGPIRMWIVLFALIAATGALGGDSPTAPNWHASRQAPQRMQMDESMCRAMDWLFI